MTDERGNLIEFATISGRWMERLARAAAVEFGGTAALAGYQMTVAQARGATVRGSGDTSDAVASERVRYGLRVTVIALGCDPVWRSRAGLEAAGPRAFGYDFDYVPVEKLAAACR